MLTPVERRDRLDRALAEKGEDGVLRRRIGTGSSFVEVPCRVFLRGYKPEQMVGGLTQQDAQAVISASPILASTFPGAAGGTRWPKVNDLLLVQGRSRNVQATATIFIGPEPVRIEMTVRG